MTMVVGKLAEHLRYLHSSTKKATDGGGYDRDKSYHCILEGKTGLDALVGEVCTLLEGRGNKPPQLFSIQLLKKIILTRFELLCVSLELQNDVEYAFAECHSLCEHTSRLNTALVYMSLQAKCAYVKFSDFAEIVLSTQTHLTVDAFLHEPSINTVVSWAKFEHGFLSALCGIFATFTSLLQPRIGQQKLKTVFVSEEMFSMAQTANLSWLDCLIPGAQSETLRLTTKELIAKLWGEVASHLVATIQPLTVGGEQTESLLTLLRDALQSKGQFDSFCI